MRIWLPALFILVLLAGCDGGPSTSQVEQQAIAYAPEIIGTAERVRAEVSGIADGQIGSLRLIATGVRPDPNLVIDPLTLTLTGVRYRRSPFAVTQLAGADFTGRISESAVNYFLKQQGRTSSGLLKNVRVQFLRNSIEVSASVVVMNIDVPVVTTGRLQAQDGLRLNYEAQNLKVAGIGVPPKIQGMLTELVNPLVDLSGLRFTPRVTRMTVEPGALVIGGTATLRNLPGQPAARP